MIFASEKIDNSNKLVNAVAYMTINNVRYELNAAFVSDAQAKFASNPDIITHTSNGITHKNLLSRCTIRIRHE